MTSRMVSTRTLLLIAFSGCSTVPLPDTGGNSSLDGKWILTTTRNLDPNSKLCDCSVCRKRGVLGLPPVTSSKITIFVRDSKILSAVDVAGASISVPENALWRSDTGVTMNLGDDFDALSAGVYVLSSSSDGSYFLSADADPTATDGRAENVTLAGDQWPARMPSSRIRDRWRR